MHCQRRMRTPTHALSAAHAHSDTCSLSRACALHQTVRHVCELNAPTGQLHGKLFAHYTEESKAFLSGDQQPVYRLQKRKVEEISQEEPFDGQVTSQVDETILFNCEYASEKQVVQSPRKERVMTDLKTASQWCLENSGDLLGSVQLPLIMCMGDDEAAEALEQFFTIDVIEHDSVEPLMFVFTFMQDMHTFLENVVDKMHLRVFCRVQN
ncbi:uncharacterized protein LOC130430130 [Triplophysa dalaica]|uniref:uncharacterized protein LOC130430130 n=1 Tax=Triplophysa dalaica TaxID=1582913 RepID=UPI0024E013BB|nr:uncharacterized protein LOC130430130 [Triplophysa dalaica]XP_056615087.1 uncharacterized protein LOC130430130 [Triplophysa dalaica]